MVEETPPTWTKSWAPVGDTNSPGGLILLKDETPVGCLYADRRQSFVFVVFWRLAILVVLFALPKQNQNQNQFVTQGFWFLHIFLWRLFHAPMRRVTRESHVTTE
eukprot:GHVU01204385.1.p1 GENE.GHVU01204385.1~~GHVU01204385.1.p1  ORF type:complete len:105 (+),score=2.54 GHVU01204385.1:282-596(+)